MKNTIILFGFLIFLIYVYFSPKSTKETFVVLIRELMLFKISLKKISI